MGATSSEEYHQPYVPDPAREADARASEPLGYNLSDPRYEQPPALLQPYGAHPSATLPTGQSIAGFVLSLVGLTSMPLLSVFASPAAIVGLVLSSIALRRSLRGLAGGRGLAIAGLVLGILGALVTILIVVTFVLFFAWRHLGIG